MDASFGGIHGRLERLSMNALPVAIPRHGVNMLKLPNFGEEEHVLWQASIWGSFQTMIF